MIESHYDLIAIFAGIVQTILYCDFFYLYITKGNNVEKIFMLILSEKNLNLSLKSSIKIFIEIKNETHPFFIK